MKETLEILLRIAGAGLMLLSFLHVPIGRKLRWREETKLMSEVNAAVFHVHTFFICLVLALMALPCLVEPGLFLERSRAAAWLSWSICLFWTTRLYFQWFVYPANLWRGRRMETGVHVCFTIIWILLAAVFGLCGAFQKGWVS